MIALATSAVFWTCTVAGSAQPAVHVSLSGSIVEHDARGAEHLVSVTTQAPKPGDVVRYSVVARNDGDRPARDLVPADRIPEGTAFEAGSAHGPAAAIEYSLDGGKTWSAHPLVSVRTPAGVAMKPADPASYSAIRWIAAKPLPPKGSVTYTFEVRVK